MDQLWICLQERKKELDEIIQYSERILKSGPYGSLRIVKNNNTDQYYLRNSSQTTYGTYIRKSNMKLIRELAQKDYAEKLLKQSIKERESIQKMIEMYSPTKTTEVFKQLSLKRQELVQPYILPNDLFITQWQNMTYERKNKDDETDCSIITERGEIVKSKSEKILADKLFLLDIPYHYEKPLYLNGYGVIYPDFLTLNKRTRKEIYWEHFGLMDKPDYCEKTIRKIETMQKNGIYLGDNLIVTFETQTHPLNIRIVEDMIKKYLL